MTVDSLIHLLYNGFMPKKATTPSPRSSKKNNSSYIEIPIPKVKRPSLGNVSYSNLLLLLVIIILSFIAGSLYTKNQYLEQGFNSAPTSAQQAFFQYARQLKLDTKKFEACFAEKKYVQRIDQQAQEAAADGVQGTPGFFVNGVFIGGAFPYESFKEVIDKELAGDASEDIATYTEPNLVQAYSLEPKVFNPVKRKISLGDSPIRGDKNAPVTLVEYSDFQCPYCLNALPTVTQVLNDYRGKVKLVYKHLPLSGHKNAHIAAEASECAREQGKFWEYHDLLFNTQQQWGSLPQLIPTSGV